MSKMVLKISFHSPNTSDETAKFLVKLIAENIANQVISQKILQDSQGDVNESQAVNLSV